MSRSLSRFCCLGCYQGLKSEIQNSNEFDDVDHNRRTRRRREFWRWSRCEYIFVKNTPHELFKVKSQIPVNRENADIYVIEFVKSIRQVPNEKKCRQWKLKITENSWQVIFCIITKKYLENWVLAWNQNFIK